MGIKIILIDGWWGNHVRMELLRVRLSSAFTQGACQAAIWPYDSSGRHPLEEIGAIFADHLRRFEEPFHIVAYSMGGLVVREALRQAPELPLSRAVFLHTPHRGTWMGHLLGLPAVRQMRPGSAFLKKLEAVSWKVPTLNVWCPGDLIVVPGWNARWAGATREIRCDVPAHTWPLVSRGLHRSIGNFLACAEEGDPPALISSSEQRTMNQEQATRSP